MSAGARAAGKAEKPDLFGYSWKSKCSASGECYAWFPRRGITAPNYSLSPVWRGPRLWETDTDPDPLGVHVLCHKRVKLSFSLSKSAWMWLVLPVQSLQMDWDVCRQPQAGVWQGPRVWWCCPAPLTYFLSDLVASEEDEGPCSTEHQGQWNLQWRSMCPDVCNPPITRLGPCSWYPLLIASRAVVTEAPLLLGGVIR